uniref:thymic stromal lymphopoietin n=1 Tax=Halichoerus grypus TaxID=9711 RepID=UPI001658FCA1|nr:thymic stromal lymphopoietin [Halichoerus grypus]
MEMALWEKDTVSFRKIFILQLVGLVLTYNFTDCDFEKIRKKYQEVIYQALEKYMNGIKSTEFNNPIYCEDPPDCLTKIERITFYPTHGCTSLAKEIFAIGTNAALTLQCPGYSGMQVPLKSIQFLPAAPELESIAGALETVARGTEVAPPLRAPEGILFQLH